MEVTRRRAKEIEEEIKKPHEKKNLKFASEGNFSHGVLSTGCTLLDLNISGGRLRGGGIPGGIVIEIFGPSQTGKTAILAEICASAQSKGGDVQFNDPEARLDKEYSRIYGMELEKKNYDRPNTVSKVFENIRNWKPEGREGSIHVAANDSLAALSTDLEMDNDEGDKRGQKRAKEFSEGLRKTCRIIAENNWIIPCTNQIRQGERGAITPGGEAIKFYSSLRLSLKPSFPSYKLEKKIKTSYGSEVEKVIGVRTECTIVKSSIDDPWRECTIYIIFNYGIDDIRGNLQYVKDILKLSSYKAIDKSFRGMDQAIEYIENNSLQNKLKEEVINLWEEVESKFKVERKRKER